MVTCQQMREAEAAYVDAGGDLEVLTQQVGERIADLIEQFYPDCGQVVGYLGKGNNATDVVIALKHLQDRGWAVSARLAFDLEEMNALARGVFSELELSEISEMRGSRVLIDGLIGIGGQGGLRSPLVELAEDMNSYRLAGRGKVVAIDVPSGVDADSGEVYEGAVQADLTITVGAVKVGLVQESAINSVGRLLEARMEGLSCAQHDEYELMTAECLSQHLPVRDFDTHKGMAGRVGVLVGHEGMRGAANVSAKAAIRSGAGLVTMFCLEDETALMESIKADEIMVKSVANWPAVADEKLDALVIGPGLGQLSEGEKADLWRLIRKTPAKLVLDAGVLSMLGEGQRLAAIPSTAVLTPHPGEMRQLMADSQGLSRFDQVSEFRRVCRACLVLKGARTLVGQEGRKTRINTTGTPGMATAGQGDCLTGIIAALMASGVDSYDAASLGVWLAGHANELAAREIAEETITVGDALSQLGGAFLGLREGRL